MRKIRLLTVAGAVTALLAFPAVAHAQYPPPTPVPTAAPGPTAATCAQLSDTTPAQGQSDTASGQSGCFTPGEQVTGQIESNHVVVFRVNANSQGGYSATFTVPSSIPAGPHTFRVIGGTSGREYARPIVIQGAGAAGTGRGGVGLPRTGADVLALALWALLAIGGGTFLIAATWKRYRLAHVEARFAAPHDAPPSLNGSDHGVIEAPRAVAYDEPVRAEVVEETPVAYTAVAVDEPVEAEWAPVSDEVVTEEAAEPATPEVSMLIGQLREEIDAWNNKR